MHWQHQPSHFWLVLVTAGLNAVLAYATGVAARRRGDRRVHLVSLAFLAASGFLALHALATPGVLLDRPNLGFVIATPIGLVLAGAFAAASALDTRAGYDQRTSSAGCSASLARLGRRLRSRSAGGRRLGHSGAAVLPLVVLSIVGVALYAFAVVRYLGLWRERGSG